MTLFTAVFWRTFHHGNHGMGEDRYELLIFIHRLVGYPTAFLIAPAALLAFARPAVHRQWGKASYISSHSYI